VPHPTISYVEDDDLVRNAVAELLRSAGFEVETFLTAEDFLQHGKPERASCLIIDVNLPGLSGLELQGHLIRSAYQIPTIFLTSNSEEQIRTKALNAGAVCFLNKPVRRNEFLSCVRKALTLSSTE
jgi:FixJ family two-component response regulator